MTLDDMGERRRKARRRFSNVKRLDERIKLAANYFNGVAIGSVVIGILRGVFDEDVDASFVDAFWLPATISAISLFAAFAVLQFFYGED